MLSFRRHIKTAPHDLLSSGLYDERTFYRAFLRDLKRCRQEVIIESPYLTTNRLQTLLPVLRKLRKRGVKIKVHTRYPGHHDELLRIQAWQSIKILRANGVKVRFFSDYIHRKIAVLDGYILWEGSLNILSQGNSREIMRRIESEQLTKQMMKFLRLKWFYW